MKSVLIRIPDTLHERLKKWSEADGRSVNRLVQEALDKAAPIAPGQLQAAFRERMIAAGMMRATPPPLIIDGVEVSDMEFDDGLEPADRIRAALADCTMTAEEMLAFEDDRF